MIDASVGLPKKANGEDLFEIARVSYGIICYFRLGMTTLHFLIGWFGFSFSLFFQQLDQLTSKIELC